jgi:drug/metabolite transporter (DMT)-like permease
VEALLTGLGRFGGEAAALGAAFLWAAATMGFRRIGEAVPPLRMNLLKNLLAALMLAATLAFSGGLASGVAPAAAGLFLASGAIGIGVGDSAYFGALRTLGARRALLMLVMAPPLTAVLAFLFLEERLAPGAAAGVLVTTAGVGWVIGERTAPSASGAVTRAGVGLGALAVLGQAAGAVLSHAAFLHAETGALTSALIRLAGGTAAVAFLLPLERARKPAVSGWTLRRLALLIPFTVFIGTYLGLTLQQLSLKLAPAGVAQTLLSTSPLFILPMAAWAGEKISLRAAAGAAVAVAGAGMLFWFR